jgi:hypothetical protein
MRYFITGCAKSGTTLVRRLFNAFDLDNIYNYDEMELSKFVKTDHKVAKRTANTLFSNILTQNEIKKQLNIIATHNIEVINVVRDKESVLKSSNGYVSEERYDASIIQSKLYEDFISYTINYDDLIQDPNKIQNELMNVFGLTKLHRWSDYPDFVNVELERHSGGIYNLRPIGKKFE